MINKNTLKYQLMVLNEIAGTTLRLNHSSNGYSLSACDEASEKLILGTTVFTAMELHRYLAGVIKGINFAKDNKL